jgi:GNAT superfamily N-acetyltransferase
MARFRGTWSVLFGLQTFLAPPGAGSVAGRANRTVAICPDVITSRWAPNAAARASTYASPVHIRLASADDARAVETIRILGWRAAYRHVFPPADLDALPIDPERWRARLHVPPPGWTTFVAEDEGRVVGFASVGPSRDEDAMGELYAIYVEPEAWSTGAGRALLAAAEEQLAREYDAGLLWVLEDNPRARRFYERAGWAPDGTRKAEERFGVRAPEVRYRKDFP